MSAHARGASSAALLLALQGLGPVPAHAGDRDSVEQAQHLIELGEEQFRQKLYAKAAGSFEKAVRILEEDMVAVPAALHRSIARAWDQAGDVVPALAAYRTFLDEAEGGGARLDDARRDARSAVDRLERLVERTSIDVQVRPAGTEVRLDGEVVGVTPFPPVKVPPGRHDVALAAPGHEPLRMEVEARAGATTPLVAALKEVDAPPAAAPARVDETPRVAERSTATRAQRTPRRAPSTASALPPLALAGTSLAMALGAVYFGLTAVSAQGDADDLSHVQGRSLDERADLEARAQDRRDDAEVRRMVALVMGAVGVAALGGAVFLWVADGGGGAAVTATF